MRHDKPFRVRSSNWNRGYGVEIEDHHFDSLDEANKFAQKHSDSCKVYDENNSPVEHHRKGNKPSSEPYA